MEIQVCRLYGGPLAGAAPEGGGDFTPGGRGCGFLRLRGGLRPGLGRRSGAGAQRVYPSVPAGGKANLRPAFLRPGGKIRVEAFAGGAGGCGHQMPVSHYREGGE